MAESVMKVRILVVDDDRICLAVTASVLKLFNYEVVTINCPLEALSTLRMNPDSFDIVLSDVHMPLMNGLNFQRIVEIEFQIPVILMSADDKKNLLMKSLENGAAFFIVKPPSISDLKNIWQYVISRRKSTSTNNSLVVKDVSETCNTITTTNTNNDNNYINNQNDEVFPKTTSYGNNAEPSLSDIQKPTIEKTENNEGKSNSSGSSKKPKLIWTTSLHNKFLEAISVIGTSRAVPKKILEYMNVPGLTRENIASHLQKYRIYVRRLNESNGAMQHGMPMNWNERPFRSSFSWSQFPTLANNSFLLKYSNTINHTQQQARTSMVPNYGSNQGLTLLNPQQNSFLQPNNNTFIPSSMNNLGANYVHDHKLNYNNNNNNLNRSMNIFESSTLDDGQNNKNYNEGEFMSNPNNNKFERNDNNGTRGSLGINMHVQENNNANINIFEMNRHGFVGPRHQPYFDGNNMVTDNSQMLGFMRHNNVVDNQFNNVANVQVDNMSNVNDVNIVVDQQEIASNASNVIISSSNMNNGSNGQVIVANNANATLQIQAVQDNKDMLTINTTTAPSAPPHDWAPNHLDDFNLDSFEEFGGDEVDYNPLFATKQPFATQGKAYEWAQNIISKNGFSLVIANSGRKNRSQPELVASYFRCSRRHHFLRAIRSRTSQTPLSKDEAQMLRPNLKDF
ncbi:hypothetical protein RND81_12G115700 [Saponaria officinalis]|uniref:Uncharacterized protein n=1 Tax=Saponaria officinalis TaxID=3572 RepID=A0AAW1H9F4_SAPOF